MDSRLAREVWHRLEVINAVTYFSPECRTATDDLGLRGFWMGYFASRAAPLGPVTARVVEATFYNFHPDRVRRAIPDAWQFADPTSVVVARRVAAAAALRRLLGDADADALARAVHPSATAALDVADGAGRPLFAANRDLAEPADPVEALWQQATTLREHRGDGHVALLVGAGLDGCEVHVLFASTEQRPATLYQASRGWSVDDWSAAVERLGQRGLLRPDGSPTTDGTALRQEIEQRTDELALAPYRVLGRDGVERLLADIDPFVERIAAAGDIVFPNPMGLPPPQGARSRDG